MVSNTSMEEPPSQYRGVGVALGAGVGMAIGALVGGWAIPLGLAVGAGVGAVVGTAVNEWQGHRLPG